MLLMGDRANYVYNFYCLGAFPSVSHDEVLGPYTGGDLVIVLISHWESNTYDECNNMFKKKKKNTAHRRDCLASDDGENYDQVSLFGECGWS